MNVIPVLHCKQCYLVRFSQDSLLIRTKYFQNRIIMFTLEL
jgi:hypothetical protein